MGLLARLLLIVSVVSTVAAAPGTASSREIEGSGRNACRDWQDLPLPVADQPTDAEAKALGPDCDSIGLYEGIGRPADYRAARLCAYVERSAVTDEGGGNELSGDGVLMMIYANGRGVARNIPLARQFTCGIWAAQAEQELRREHLDAMEKAADPGSIHICDDITSGFMMGQCGWLDGRQADALRNQRLDVLSRDWPRLVITAYVRLRAAASAFAESSAGNEQDMSGTARGLIFHQRRVELEDEFEQRVVGFVRGTFPSGADEPGADRELNTAYRAALKAYETPELPETIDKDGLREAERAWLAYRDAWMGFARALRPQENPSKLLQALTTIRAEQLKELATGE